MYSTILVPLDGSAVAEGALGYAALIPSERVKLIRVEQPGHPALPGADASGSDARAYLERRAEPLRRQGRDVETVVLRGDPATQIIANAGGADLIVMTTRGLGSGSRKLFGSVADRVSRRANVPTLLVRADGDATAMPPSVARIVVPLDGSEIAAHALETAARIAALLGVPIHLIGVLETDLVRASVQAGEKTGEAYARSRETLHGQARDELEAQARRLWSRNLKTTTELRDGPPAVELLDAIAPSDLVVMATHGRGGLSRWLLGSVAEKLVREAAAPVLLVRAGAPPS